MSKLLINKVIFEELFKENYDSLYYHAYSFVDESELARDIVNDAFEEIWKRRNQLDVTYSLKYLLYSIVKNKSLNHLRRQDVEKRYVNRALHASALDEETYKDYDPILDEIMKAIESLPTQGRAVFKKCFIENLTYKEAAEELDVSINTIKTHVAHSLKRLRQDLDRDILLFFLQIRKKT